MCVYECMCVCKCVRAHARFSARFSARVFLRAHTWTVSIKYLGVKKPSQKIPVHGTSSVFCLAGSISFQVTPNNFY